MEVYNKFIIENDETLGDCLILGRVTYHKQLAYDESKVKSGGWWKLKDDRITFYGESYDFGRATLEQVTNAVLNDKVFTSRLLEHSIAKKHNFSFDNQSEIIEII